MSSPLTAIVLYAMLWKPLTGCGELTFFTPLDSALTGRVQSLRTC
ncbi:hypothetical protein ABIB90_008367 [Bradyrhizobium sp. JR4.1]